MVYKINMKSIKQIAIQQIVNDGKTHSCCICYNFEDANPLVTEKHLIDKHPQILKSIAEVQSN